ncbi:hypothetical protein BH09BAC1_BH09BAC1_21550 [soil metagenome]
MALSLRRKRIWIPVVVILLLVCLFLFRYPIMRGLGSFLIATDEPQQVPVAFVLSGGPFDRGTEGAKLFKQNLADTIICTGESIPQDVFALGMVYTEGAISKVVMTNQGVPEANIKLIEEGTSTLEESEIILAYCKATGLTKIGIVSTKFHTRRIRGVFKDKFKDAGIEVVIFGAPAAAYHEETWWENEHGLISLNNEYIKILYYWIKY